MFVITGINSGLGKYLHENLPNTIGINRENKNLIMSQIPNDSTILHCAFNSKRDIGDYSQYVKDNYLFTKELLEIRGIKKFIYFSSIDVYGPSNPYSFMKKCAEDLILNTDKRASIIRISGPLGPTMRKNSLTRLFANEKLTLSRDSLFNYILQEDILKSINMFTEVSGIFDFYCSSNVTLGEIAKEFNLEGYFGEFLYKIFLENSKGIKNIYQYNKNSLENIKLFLDLNYMPN